MTTTTTTTLTTGTTDHDGEVYWSLEARPCWLWCSYVVFKFLMLFGILGSVSLWHALFFALFLSLTHCLGVLSLPVLSVCLYYLTGAYSQTQMYVCRCGDDGGSSQHVCHVLSEIAQGPCRLSHDEAGSLSGMETSA